MNTFVVEATADNRSYRRILAARNTAHAAESFQRLNPDIDFDTISASADLHEPRLSLRNARHLHGLDE